MTAKRAGHLGAVGTVLDRMVALGVFVTPALRQRVLELAAEGRES